MSLMQLSAALATTPTPTCRSKTFQVNTGYIPGHKHILPGCAQTGRDNGAIVGSCCFSLLAVAQDSNFFSPLFIPGILMLPQWAVTISNFHYTQLS